MPRNATDIAWGITIYIHYMVKAVKNYCHYDMVRNSASSVRCILGRVGVPCGSRWPTNVLYGSGHYSLCFCLSTTSRTWNGNKSSQSGDHFWRTFWQRIVINRQTGSEQETQLVWHDRQHLIYEPIGLSAVHCQIHYNIDAVMPFIYVFCCFFIFRHVLDGSRFSSKSIS